MKNLILQKFINTITYKSCLRRNPSSAFSGRVTRNEALKPAERHSLFGRIEDNINTTS